MGTADRGMPFIADITDFIFLEDEPERADAILVPGNAWPQPARRAAGLYHEGLAPLILVSGRYSRLEGRFQGPACDRERYSGAYETEADYLKAVLELEGVPSEAVWPEREAEYTLENAQKMRQLLEASGRSMDRLIVCCQAFHARRCRMYFEYVFRDRETRFFMCPAVTQGISRDSWTETEAGLHTVLGELRRCGEQFDWMLAPGMAER